MSEWIPISALNRYAKQLIESDEVLSQVWVEGEIRGFSVNQATGHAFFSLREGNCGVRAVMFRQYASSLRFMPADGMRVVAQCKVSLYERDGAFQLVVFDLMPRGAGVLKQQADAMRNKLEAEGLFAPGRKRPIPPYPTVIGVVASPSSAALQDIISVLSRRNPAVRLVVYPAATQGTGAAQSLIHALATLGSDGRAQVAIIARGGGSKEDLASFNDEALIRAAATLRIPLISAVGHETDTTLMDLVCDLRAPTPSAAAELAVRSAWDLLDEAHGVHRATRELVRNTIANRALVTSHLRDRLRSDIDALLRQRTAMLEICGATLEALNPDAVLRRGYALVSRGTEPVTRAAHVREQDALAVRLQDGVLSCLVESVERNQDGE